MQVVEEREDTFAVDPDWVMPQLKRLVHDGGRLDQEVRTLDNTYFDTPRCWAAVVWTHPAASGRRLGDGLAVESSKRNGSHGIAERLAHEDAAVGAGQERGRSAGG